jgi:hypothetical protein
MKVIRLLLCGLLFLSFACQHCTDRERLPEVAPTGLVMGSAPETPPQGTVDLQSRPLPLIAPGTVIGDGAPKGWSHLVLIATPALPAAALKEAPKTAADYARMFKFTLLANVIKKAGSSTYSLDVVGRGFAVAINGKETIIDSEHTLGADMGLFGRRILDENEKICDKELRQVARTDTMMIFDAQSVMKWQGRHTRMVVRHAFLVFPESGRLATLVWLLTRDQAGAYGLAEPAVQLLPPNMHEERMLSIDPSKFFLGMPTADAFALARIPQGTALPYSPELSRLAAVKDFRSEQVLGLEAALRAAVRQATVR